MQNGVVTLENSLMVPQKIKHAATIGSSNSTPSYILLPHKRKHMSTEIKAYNVRAMCFSFIW